MRQFVHCIVRLVSLSFFALYFVLLSSVLSKYGRRQLDSIDSLFYASIAPLNSTEEFSHNNGSSSTSSSSFSESKLETRKKFERSPFIKSDTSAEPSEEEKEQERGERSQKKRSTNNREKESLSNSKEQQGAQQEAQQEEHSEKKQEKEEEEQQGEQDEQQQEQSRHKSEQQQPSIYRDEEEWNSSTKSMSACLLVMDDNHWLSEWLAYHYFVLPLRHLIVIKDPRSRTSPEEIFNRWRQPSPKTGTPRMTIEEVFDADVIPAKMLKIIEEKGDTMGNAKNKLVILHRFRQQYFMVHCLKEMQKKGKEWVLFVDTDEYIRPNPFIEHPDDNNKQLNLHEPGSVLNTIESHESHDGPEAKRKCHYFPRIQITSQDSPPTPFLPDVLNSTRQDDHGTLRSLGINASHFLTTRWRYHNGQELKGPNNQDGKNMIHVGRLDPGNIPKKAENAHKILPKVCLLTTGGLNASGSTTSNTTATPNWLVINHYFGTYEQYTYRDDPRDNITHRTKRSEQWKTAGQPPTVEDTLTPTWLEGFVRSEGEEEARKLLKNIGVLEPKR